MSARRRGRCNARGPGPAHCTDRPAHDYSHYDDGEDVSWNDRMWEEWELTPHECDDEKCVA